MCDTKKYENGWGFRVASKAVRAISWLFDAVGKADEALAVPLEIVGFVLVEVPIGAFMGLLPGIAGPIGGAEAAFMRLRDGLWPDGTAVRGPWVSKGAALTVGVAGMAVWLAVTLRQPPPPATGLFAVFLENDPTGELLNLAAALETVMIVPFIACCRLIVTLPRDLFREKGPRRWSAWVEAYPVCAAQVQVQGKVP